VSFIVRVPGAIASSCGHRIKKQCSTRRVTLRPCTWRRSETTGSNVRLDERCHGHKGLLISFCSLRDLASNNKFEESDLRKPQTGTGVQPC